MQRARPHPPFRSFFETDAEYETALEDHSVRERRWQTESMVNLACDIIQIVAPLGLAIWFILFLIMETVR